MKGLCQYHSGHCGSSLETKLTPNGLSCLYHPEDSKKKKKNQSKSTGTQRQVRDLLYCSVPTKFENKAKSICCVQVKRWWAGGNYKEKEGASGSGKVLVS